MTSAAARRRPLWVLGVAVLLAAALGGWSAFLLVGDQRESERDNAVLCEAVNVASSSLRNLLVAARNQTPPERLTRRARRFYREQIAAVKPLDCGHFNRRELQRQQRRQTERAQRSGGDATSRAGAQQSPLPGRL